MGEFDGGDVLGDLIECVFWCCNGFDFIGVVYYVIVVFNGLI